MVAYAEARYVEPYYTEVAGDDPVFEGEVVTPVVRLYHVALGADVWDWAEGAFDFGTGDERVMHVHCSVSYANEDSFDHVLKINGDVITPSETIVDPGGAGSRHGTPGTSSNEGGGRRWTITDLPEGVNTLRLEQPVGQGVRAACWFTVSIYDRVRGIRNQQSAIAEGDVSAYDFTSSPWYEGGAGEPFGVEAMATQIGDLIWTSAGTYGRNGNDADQDSNTIPAGWTSDGANEVVAFHDNDILQPFPLDAPLIEKVTQSGDNAEGAAAVGDFAPTSTSVDVYWTNGAKWFEVFAASMMPSLDVLSEPSVTDVTSTGGNLNLTSEVNWGKALWVMTYQSDDAPTGTQIQNIANGDSHDYEGTVVNSGSINVTEVGALQESLTAPPGSSLRVSVVFEGD